jgi:hypothetical protein
VTNVKNVTSGPDTQAGAAQRGELVVAGRTSLRCASVRSTIHNWWPIAAFLSFVLTVQVVFTNSIVANGKHASDHRQSAEVIFPVTFFLAVIFWHTWVGANRLRLGHSLVDIGTTAGVAVFVLFIAVLRTHRIVRTGPAIAAAALSLLPLIVPGIGPLALLGIVVLTADLCMQRAHQPSMAATPVWS